MDEVLRVGYPRLDNEPFNYPCFPAADFKVIHEDVQAMFSF